MKRAMNRSVDEELNLIKILIDAAKEKNLKVRGHIAWPFGN